jgi:hypothetical protein
MVETHRECGSCMTKTQFTQRDSRWQDCEGASFVIWQHPPSLRSMMPDQAETLEKSTRRAGLATICGNLKLDLHPQKHSSLQAAVLRRNAMTEANLANSPEVGKDTVSPICQTLNVWRPTARTVCDPPPPMSILNAASRRTSVFS